MGNNIDRKWGRELASLSIEGGISYLYGKEIVGRKEAGTSGW